MADKPKKKFKLMDAILGTVCLTFSSVFHMV